MNELQVFENTEFGKVRTDYDSEGNVVFCGSDVAKALGYSNVRDAVNRHCKGVVKRDTLTNGGFQALSFVPESDVYRLIAHSKLPSAVRFEKWVFEDVLPKIRRTGAYMTPDTIKQVLTDPNYIIQIATNWKKTEDALRESEKKVAALTPKASYADSILNADGTLTITQIAKDYGMSGQRMNQVLQGFGVQYKQNGQWLPKHKYHNKGYTKSKTVTIPSWNGIPAVHVETMWTQTGRKFIYDLLKRNGIVPTAERSRRMQ